MATNVPLTLSVETVGTEGVRRLKDDVAALGKQGAAAAPEFAALAAEIEDLAKQAGLANLMKNLTGEVEQLSVAQAATATKSREATAALKELQAITDGFVQKERDAKAAVEAARKALSDLNIEKARAKVDTSAAAKEESTYTDRMRDLERSILNAKVARQEAIVVQKAAKAETVAAVAAENELSSATQKSNREATLAQAAYAKKAALLRETVGELRKYGLEVETVTAAEFGLIATYKSLAGQISAVQAAQAAKVAAAKAAAAEEDRLAIIQIVRQKELKAAAAQAAQEIIGDYAKMEAAQAKLAAQTKAAGDALNNAFGTVGVRSVAAIRAEIADVNAAMTTLSQKGGLTGAELRTAMASAQAQVNALEKEIRTVTGQLTLADKAANLFSSSMGQFTAGNLVAQGVGVVASKLADMGRAFLDAMIKGQQLSRGLNAIYKDSTIAAAQIDFLRKSSSAAGVSFGGLSTEFVKFSAAMNSANVPIEQSNALFAAVTRAASSLGLGAEATAGSLNALGQMASKGTVSLEELRAQLGDRLPGALGLTAKGFGITEAQLIKLVESGNLATRDFIEPFTKALGELAGETDGLLPTYERFKGLLTQTSQSAGEAGGLSILTGTLKVLGGTLGAVVLGLSVLGEGLALVGSLVVAFYAKLRGDANAFGFFNEQSQKATDRLAANAAAFNAFLDPANSVVDATADLGKASALTAAETAKLESSIKSATVATNLSSAAAKLASDTTLTGAGSIVRFTVAADALIAKQEVITEGLQKSAKATKDQGDQMITLAKLSGDAAQLRSAEAAAADAQTQALQRVADSQQAEVDLLIVQRQRKLEAAEATGAQGAALADLTAAIDKKLAKALPELEQMQQAANAAQAEAVARRLANDALRDNSALMDSSAALMLRYTAEVEALKNAEGAGVDVKALLYAAQQKLSEATLLHTDALKDNAAKIAQKSQLEQAAIQVSIALAQASQSNNAAMASQYKALGDNTTAQYYEIKAKQDAITVIRLQMDMTRAMNAVRALEIEATLKTLTGTDDLTRAKVNALEVEKEMLKVKNIGNEAMRSQITLIEAEISALRNGTSARQGSTSGVNSDTSARNANADAIDRQTTALEKQRKLTSDGFEANADGSAKGSFNSSTANGGLFELQTKQRRNTLGASDLSTAEAAYQKALDNQEWLDAFRNQNPGGSSFEAVKSTRDATESAKNILDAVRSAVAQGEAAKTATGPSTSHSVSITIGNSNSTVNMASAADANALSAMLASLNTAAGRAI